MAQPADLFVSVVYDAVTKEITFTREDGTTSAVNTEKSIDFLQTDNTKLDFVLNKPFTTNIDQLSDRANILNPVDRCLAVYPNYRVDIYSASEAGWVTLFAGLSAYPIVPQEHVEGQLYAPGNIVRVANDWYRAEDYSTDAPILNYDPSADTLASVSTSVPEYATTDLLKGHFSYLDDIVFVSQPTSRTLRLHRYPLPIVQGVFTTLDILDVTKVEVSVTADGNIVYYGENAGYKNGGWVMFKDQYTTTFLGEYNIQTLAGTVSPIDRTITNLHPLPNGTMLIGTLENTYIMSNQGIAPTILSSSSQILPNSLKHSKEKNKFYFSPFLYRLR